MRRLPPGILLLSVLAVGALFAVQAPGRRFAISVLRFPFTAVKVAAQILMTVPRLPSLAAENGQLRAELAQRGLEAAQLREALRLIRHVDELAGTLPALRGVTASILTRSVLPTQHTVALDKGQRHGLELDGVAVDEAGVVGRVVELYPSTCLVALLTDPESRVAGMVERSRETGLLLGSARAHCEFVYLDVGADIREGDRIVTAGLGGPFPKGLLLGRVKHVLKDERSGSARAWVDPSAHLGRLEEVLCLRPARGGPEDEGGVR